MSASTSNVTPNEYTFVMLLGGVYAPFHAQGREKTPLGALGRDLKIAEVAAKAFAEKNKIPYCAVLMKTAKPIMALAQRNGLWYPTILRSDKFQLITTFAGKSIGMPSQDHAAEFAKKILVIHQTLADYEDMIDTLYLNVERNEIGSNSNNTEK